MIIAIAHEKGGCGKTVTGLNLIPILKPNLIIDLDPLACLTTFNGLRDKKLNVIWCESNNELLSLLKSNLEGDILIDCGGFDSEATRTAIASADVILTPCNGDPSELIGLMRFNKVLEQISINIDEKLTGYVIINRVNPRTKNHSEIEGFVSGANNLKLLKSVIPSRRSVVKATKIGCGIVEIKSKDDTVLNAQKEFKSLSKEIKDIL